MTRVAVRILHASAGPGGGPLETLLVDARQRLAESHADAFRRLGAADVAIVAGPPDDTPFGARLRAIVARDCPDGLVVLGSGALALARPRDLAAFLDVAAGPPRRALANNRYSADAVAIAGAGALLELPDLPSDNALSRWLAEVAGFEVADLATRWRLAIDFDSPLDLILAGLDTTAPELTGARARLAAVAGVAANRRAELLVAGRTSASTLRWLERNAASRVRALVEERGLRASSRLALGVDPSLAATRPPRSLLGELLDRDGPDALGAILARLADAAVVDTRVLLAHGHGADEGLWPIAEDRFASDLLLPDRIGDPWLKTLTAAVAQAPIPIALGGHTLVGPALRLALGVRQEPAVAR